MKPNDKLNNPAKGVKKQQVKKKVKAFTPTKKKNSEITINDPDTQYSIEKLGNTAKDSKSVNGSNKSFPSSLDVKKRSLNKSGESSNTDRGKGNIGDTNVQTAITEKDDIENAKKVAAFVRQVLDNELPKGKIEWPLCLLIASKQSVTISQQEFQNMIINKSAEVMATKSYFANQMDNLSICEEQQDLYFKKYQQLINDIDSMNAELDLLTRMPRPSVKHVRNVATNVNI